MLAAAPGIVPLCPAQTSANKPVNKPPTPLAARPLNLPGEISDERMESYLDENAERLLKSGQTVKMADLLRQLHRRSVTLQLPKPATSPVSTVELAARARAGVLVIGDLYKCKKCPRWHVGVSSGFVLSTNGVCATCYHVVNVPDSPTLVAMTGDGRVVPVREVLAANPHTDVALLRLDGTGYVPLPLDTEAPVGADVRVLSHPDDHFFTFSQGIISRYVSVPLEKRAGEVTMMAITADFGAGSSGAPAFNAVGGVIGMVNNTQSLYYDPKRGRDLQMVFKHCLPSQYIRELIH
ncbi:MAG TPA: serine protease [Candidatus Saccharimonadales bacterium]|nr:serine protease [Candidatus Saccharimonadales bacterium]